jgi:hypothetical protein
MNPALIVVIIVGVPILVCAPFLDGPMPKLRLFVGRLGVTALGIGGLFVSYALGAGLGLQGHGGAGYGVMAAGLVVDLAVCVWLVRAQRRDVRGQLLRDGGSYPVVLKWVFRSVVGAIAIFAVTLLLVHP